MHGAGLIVPNNNKIVLTAHHQSPSAVNTNNSSALPNHLPSKMPSAMNAQPAMNTVNLNTTTAEDGKKPGPNKNKRVSIRSIINSRVYLSNNLTSN